MRERAARAVFFFSLGKRTYCSAVMGVAPGAHGTALAEMGRQGSFMVAGGCCGER